MGKWWTEEADALEVVFGKTEAAKTFAVAVRDYLREMCPSSPHKFRRLRQIACGRRSRYGHLPYGGRWWNCPLFEVTPEMIQDELCECRFRIVRVYEERGEPLPRRYLQRFSKNSYTAYAYLLHAQFSAFFEWAVRTGRLNRSPMDEVTLPPKSVLPNQKALEGG